MLYLVGLGLSDETDITVKGLEVVKNASRVYLEAYTSILLVDQSVLVCVLANPVTTYKISGKKELTLTLQVGKILWTVHNHRRPGDGRVKQR